MEARRMKEEGGWFEGREGKGRGRDGSDGRRVDGGADLSQLYGCTEAPGV